MRRSIPAGSIPLLACALSALAPSCADTRIAPSYPGTLVLVADDASNSLAEVEPNGGHVRYRYAVPAPVAAIATARNGQYAAVISTSGAAVVCDLGRQGRDAEWSLAGHGRPTGLVFADRRSTLAASFADSGAILLVGRESGRVEGRIATECGSVVALQLAKRGDSIWALCDGPPALVRVDPDGARVVERRALDGSPSSFVVGDDEASAWIVIGSTGGAYAWNAAAGRVELGAGPAVLGADLHAQTVVASLSTRGELVVLRADGEAANVHIPVAEPDGSRAWPVRVDPDGRWAFVAIAAEGRVVVVDLGTHAVRGAFDIGGAPGTIAWTLMRAPSEFESDSDSGGGR